MKDQIQSRLASLLASPLATWLAGIAFVSVAGADPAAKTPGDYGGGPGITAPAAVDGIEPGARGGQGLAMLARKVICAEYDGRQVIDNAVVLVKDGLIEAVGKRGELTVPSGYEVLDVGEKWLMPGLVEMHNHVAVSYTHLTLPTIYSV